MKLKFFLFFSFVAADFLAPAFANWLPECGVKKSKAKTTTEKPDNDADIKTLGVEGGDVMQPHEWPWLASIGALEYTYHNQFKYTHLCNGLIIDTKRLVTGGDCLHKMKLHPPQYLAAILAAHNISHKAVDGNNARKVIAWINYIKPIDGFKTHQPDGNSVSYTVNNLAYVELHGILDFVDNHNLGVTCLPCRSSAWEAYVGQRAVFAGWGGKIDDPDNGDKEDNLDMDDLNWNVLEPKSKRLSSSSSGNSLNLLPRKLTNVQVVPMERCRKRYGLMKPEIVNHLLCYEMEKTGNQTFSCQADLGDPLMMQIGGKWTLVGINSFKDNCNEENWLGIALNYAFYSLGCRND